MPNIHVRYYAYRGIPSGVSQVPGMAGRNFNVPELDYAYPVDLNVLGRMVDAAVARWGHRSESG